MQRKEKNKVMDLFRYLADHRSGYAILQAPNGCMVSSIAGARARKANGNKETQVTSGADSNLPLSGHSIVVQLRRRWRGAGSTGSVVGVGCRSGAC
jgi:hypothetical protein